MHCGSDEVQTKQQRQLNKSQTISLYVWLHHLTAINRSSSNLTPCHPIPHDGHRYLNITTKLHSSPSVDLIAHVVSRWVPSPRRSSDFIVVDTRLEQVPIDSCGLLLVSIVNTSFKCLIDILCKSTVTEAPSLPWPTTRHEKPQQCRSQCIYCEKDQCWNESALQWLHGLVF